MDFKLYFKDYGERYEGRGDDAWNEWHDYVYHGITVVKDGYSHASLFPGEVEPQIGDEVYVVYVSYDTGDSFGSEEGVREHLWVFTNKKRANRFCSAITNDAKNNPDYDFKGKPLKFEGVPVNTNSWKGYFEHFRTCNFETLTLFQE
jgi:hypothetical protein